MKLYDFGKLLRQARLDVGMTQVELARRVKRSQQTISFIEHKDRAPLASDYRAELMRAVGIPFEVGEIFAGVVPDTYRAMDVTIDSVLRALEAFEIELRRK